MNLGARRRESVAARCAYCHDAQRGALVECPRCHVVVHVDCRETLGRCPTLGCASGAAVPAHGGEVFVPNGRWFANRGLALAREAALLAGVVGLIGLVLALAVSVATLDPHADAAEVDAVFRILWIAATAGAAAFLAGRHVSEWRRGRRLVATCQPAARFLTLARAGDRWRLQLRAERADLSPAEVIDGPSLGYEAHLPGWLRGLAPLTPVTVFGLERPGEGLAIVDALGRLHVAERPRRIGAAPHRNRPA